MFQKPLTISFRGYFCADYQQSHVPPNLCFPQFLISTNALVPNFIVRRNLMLQTMVRDREGHAALSILNLAEAPVLAAAVEFGAQAVANTIWALAKLGCQVGPGCGPIPK